MTNKTSKLLSILVSTLVLAGFVSNALVNSEPTVSAAKHHEKKHNKKKHSVKKKAVTHKVDKRKSGSNSTSNAANSTTTNTSSSNNTIDSQSKYSSLSDWYVANGLKLYSKYTYDKDNIADDQEFGLGYTNGEGGVIYTEHYNNELYKEGQILGTVFNDAAPEYAVTALPQQTGKTMKQLYQDAIDTYNSAGPYIQANASYKVIQTIGPNNQWGPDGD